MAGADDNKRLIGEDGMLVKGKLLAEVTGNAVLTIAANTWVRITALGAGETLFDDLIVGDFYYNPKATASTAPVAGTKWRPLDIDPASVTNAGMGTMMDITGWSLEIAADEIDTTVLSDNFKKYRKGKKDANGSVKFVYIKGKTDIAGALTGQFFRVADITAAGAVTVTPIDNEPVYLIGYIDQTTVQGNTRVGTVMQVEFFNYSLPMNMGEAVNMDVPFRLVGDSDPVLYRIVNA